MDRHRFKKQIIETLIANHLTVLYG